MPRRWRGSGARARWRSSSEWQGWRRLHAGEGGRCDLLADAIEPDNIDREPYFLVGDEQGDPRVGVVFEHHAVSEPHLHVGHIDTRALEPPAGVELAW
jgi:hypothetical protein